MTYICPECASGFYPAVMKKYICKRCEKEEWASNGGEWTYCEPCARELKRCQMCSEKYEEDNP